MNNVKRVVRPLMTRPLHAIFFIAIFLTTPEIFAETPGEELVAGKDYWAYIHAIVVGVMLLGLVQMALGTLWNKSRYRKTGAYSEKYTTVSVLGFIEFCYGILVILVLLF